MRSDFWKFWTGETISNLGSSITQFALPLLVFKLTGSARKAPHARRGSVQRGRARLGAAPRRPRGVPSVWWIYAAIFASATLGIFFERRTVCRHSQPRRARQARCRERADTGSFINTGSLRQAMVPNHLLGRAERYLEKPAEAAAS